MSGRTIVNRKVEDKETEISLREVIRTRPAIFIGRVDERGIVALISGVLQHVVAIFEKRHIIVEIRLLRDNTFSIELDIDANQLIEAINATGSYVDWYLPGLPHLSQHMVIKYAGQQICYTDGIPHTEQLAKVINKHPLIIFVPDGAIFRDRNVDYHHLSGELFRFALLNRHVVIHVKDIRHKFHRQDYYHFPQGVFYLFERRLKDMSSYGILLSFQEEFAINGSHYQVAFVYHNTNDDAYIKGYEADIVTAPQSSHVVGVIDGIAAACRQYFGDSPNIKVKKKKLLRALSLVCSIKGRRYNYAGSTRERVDEPAIRKEIKQAVCERLIEKCRDDLEHLRERCDMDDPCYEFY